VWQRPLEAGQRPPEDTIWLCCFYYHYYGC
jgi:hypothetical protein